MLFVLRKRVIRLKELKGSKKRIFDYLSKCSDEGIIPSVREICEATGLSSTSTVHVHLKALEEAGYIIREHGHRSIRIAGKEGAVSVPVIGRVTAGLPIYAYEYTDGYVQISSKKAAGRELFALRVKGESMRDAGILSGDVVICEKTQSARNGDIVVALIGEEATVKTFFAENGRYRLQPQNPDFEPIVVDELTVLGKVISLYRDY